MNKTLQSVKRIFEGALTAYKRYPASIGMAVIFTIVTMIRIQLEWQQQLPFNFLFNCLHWSLALGAIISLTTVVYTVIHNEKKSNFWLANIIGLSVAIVTFLILYFFAQINSPDIQYTVISTVARIRISVLILVSLILFVHFASFEEGNRVFDLSLFMTEKAFFIAVIYGFVIFLGATGVASAFEFLVYNNMSYKVYMYLGAISGLIGYTVFVGYFPDFNIGAADPKRSEAQRQPRFIEILFTFIMVPIFLALTFVLLIWAIRTIMSGMQVRFIQLYSIAASYTIGGLWLHTMILRNESNPAKLYQKVYPPASLFILIFEAWAVIHQLAGTGLKTTEYVFIVLWLLALIGNIFILTKKTNAHTYIALTASILAILSIMPIIGYQALPINAQINRLEKLLVSQGMLENDVIIPAETEIDETVKIAITDAANYLMRQHEFKLPAWYSPDLFNVKNFSTIFGFEPVWPEEDYYGVSTPGDYRGIYLALGANAMPITDYDWVVSLQNNRSDQTAITFTGENGNYSIVWYTPSDTEAPSIRISLNGEIVTNFSLKAYFNDLSTTYDLNNQSDTIGTFDDMSIKIETDAFDAMLVLSYAEYSFNTRTDDIHYWAEPNAIYIHEK